MKSPLLLSTMLLMINLMAGCGTGLQPATPVGTATFTTRRADPSPNAPEPTSAIGSTVVTCTPTLDDGLSPTYKSNSPVRSHVGQGHVLTGVVRSSRDCAPIPNAQLELWPEYAGQGHPDNARATIYTDGDGQYRFECDPPEHIHMRISAPGYQTLAQNSYHPNGQAEGTFDVVLAPNAGAEPTH